MLLRHGITRRNFVAFGVASVALAASTSASGLEGPPMYGVIVKLIANPGQRDSLTGILVEATAGIAGCLSYVVARDASDPNAIWITEVWTGKEAHDASLSLPAVKEAMVKGRQLIASFGSNTITEPIGGVGLSTSHLK